MWFCTGLLVVLLQLALIYDFSFSSHYLISKSCIADMIACCNHCCFIKSSKSLFLITYQKKKKKNLYVSCLFWLFFPSSSTFCANTKPGSNYTSCKSVDIFIPLNDFLCDTFCVKPIFGICHYSLPISLLNYLVTGIGSCLSLCQHHIDLTFGMNQHICGTYSYMVELGTAECFRN